jgi:hypothetical protein
VTGEANGPRIRSLEAELARPIEDLVKEAEERAVREFNGEDWRARAVADWNRTGIALLPAGTTFRTVRGADGELLHVVTEPDEGGK